MKAWVFVLWLVIGYQSGACPMQSLSVAEGGFPISVVELGPGPLAQLPDRPDPDEDFRRFFFRLTRGGPFRGIDLVAPQWFEAEFYRWIFRGQWVGRRDRAYREVESSGVSLWHDWFPEDKPLRVGIAAPIAAQLERQLPNDLWDKPWSEWTLREKRAFALVWFQEVNFTDGRSLLGWVAERFEISADELRKNVDVDILDHSTFVARVRELGWSGPVYFRGITAPHPQQAGRHLVYLDGETLAKTSAFEHPVTQLYEWAGLLAHEYSHVAQDLEARRLGIELAVSTPEGALLIEGMAEWQAEQAQIKASEHLPAPSAFALFPHEQAVEIVYREGNEQSGMLFPYTVGLPFFAAWSQGCAERMSAAALRGLAFQIIVGQRSLSEGLSQSCQ